MVAKRSITSECEFVVAALLGKQLDSSSSVGLVEKRELVMQWLEGIDP